MLKKLAPPLAVLLSLLLDTAIIPVFYYGQYLIPLTLITVISIGVLMGRMNGMLYGMISGLLLDVTAGTLGMKFVPYLLIGFLIGFLLDEQPEITRSMEKSERIQLIAVHAIWIFALVALYEIVMLVIQYFNTAIFEWRYVLNLVLRTGAVTLLCLLLQPFFRRIFLGKASVKTAGRSTREVKHF